MFKFRPIAPKPVAAGSGSSCSTMENNDGYGAGARRRKRKYVRTKNKQTKKTKVSSAPPSSSVSGGGDEVVTLSLMPETPDRKENSPATSSQCEIPDLVLLSPGHVQQPAGHVVNSVAVADHTGVMTSSPPRQVVSFVTVECVNGGAPPPMNMEVDTCPSFVTDGGDTVVWMNKAYKEMVSGGGSDEIVVVKKHNPVNLPAFTCKVKVTWGAAPPSTLTAPCDVWRMQSGAYAWRLDVKAALSLGR